MDQTQEQTQPRGPMSAQDRATRAARRAALTEANAVMRAAHPGAYQVLLWAWTSALRDPAQPEHDVNRSADTVRKLAQQRAHADLRQTWPQLWADTFPAAYARQRAEQEQGQCA